MKAGFKAMEKGFTWLLLLILLVAFAGCGGGSGGGTTAISGKVIDGPVSNASITVYQVTSTGFAKAGTGSTGADGSFSLSIPNYNSADYYILYVSGGSFENNNVSTGAPDMVGFLAPGGSHQVFITPITTLIGEQLFTNGVLNQNLNAAQVDAALNQMLAVLGQIFQAMGSNSLNGISSSDPTGQTNLDQLLAELNSILQELANDVAAKSGEGYQNAMKDLGKYIGDNPGDFGKEIGAAMNGGNFSFINFNFTGGNGGTINISGTLNNDDQTNLGNLEKQPPFIGISNIPATFSVTPNFSVWVVNKPATPGTAGTVTKLDSSGNKIGTYTVGDDPDSIAIDKSGNVWVAGDAVVTELGPTGSLLRTCSLNTGDKNTALEDPNQIAIDPSGNVWVTDIYGYTSDLVTIAGDTPYNNGYGEGETVSSNTETDWHGAVIEINPSNCAIEKTIDVHSLTNGQTDSPGPIAVDPSGNIWVISAGPLNAAFPTTYLTEVSPAGSLLQGPFQEDQLSSLAVDTSGNVWVMDNQRGVKAPAGVGEFNVTTKKYSEFNAGYGPDTVAVDPSGNIWTGGYGGQYAIEWNSSGSEIKNYNMGYYAQPSQGTIAFDPSGDAWVVPGNEVSGVVVINPSSGATAVYSVANPVAIAISANASNTNSNGGGSGGSTTTGGSNTSPSVPSAPAGLFAKAGNNQVSLSWTASSGASSYNVYRGSSSGALSTKTKIGSGATSTSYPDTTAVNGTTYYYQVTAVNSTGESAGSNEASATPAGSSNGAGFLYSVNRDGTTTVYSIDQTTGALTALESTVAFNGNVSITVDPSGKFAYVPDYGNGVIDVYTIDQATGALTAGTPVADSSGPVSLTVDSDKFAYAGNVDNTTTICEINQTTGALTVGASGVDVNNVTVVPPGKFAYAALNFVPDVYNVNQTNGILTDSGNRVGNSGNNLIVAPSGKFAYDVNPSGLIDVYTINQTTGVLTQVDNSQQFGSSLDQFNIDPLGRFLYVTDYLLTPGTQVYTIDQTTGLLTAGTTADTHGASSLTFDPSGKFAYALSSNNQTIYVYTIDQTTGALTAGASVNNPNMFWSIAVQ